MKTKGLKIIASLLVFMLTFTYISVVQEAFATAVNELNEIVGNNTISETSTVGDTNVMPEPQNNVPNGTRTGNANVDFDVYFERTGDKRYSAKKRIGEENFVYVKVKVIEGYLKSSSLVFDKPNFKISRIDESNYVSNYTDTSIVFSQIPSNTEFELKVYIVSLTGEKVQEDCMYKYDNATFNGTYVDNSAKEKTVEGPATVGLMWLADLAGNLEVNLENVITYTTGTKKNIAVQLSAKATLTNNTLPLDTENIEISLPIIDSQAEQVYVSAKTTKQINGEEEPTTFSSTNYGYDNIENKLTIEINNLADSNGNISWKKNAYDEYIITAVYDATNINLDAQNYTTNCAGKVKFTAANKEEVSYSFEDRRITLSKDTSKNIVDYEIKANTPRISKGQIYANYNAETKLDTEFEETVVANITYANMIGKLTISQSADNFIDDNGGSNSTITSNGVNSSYFKTISIGKSNFNKIMGEEGKVYIYSGETLIQTIDKNTVVSSANNYEVDISTSNINEIKIETTKPVSEGKLLIYIKKAIKGDIGYTMNQVRRFAGLETDIVCSTLYDGVTGSESDMKKCSIELVEPQTMAELVIDKPDLSTVLVNKDVKLTAVLRTDSLDCRLYKDPTINIVFPSYIDNIALKNVDVRFETEGTKLEVASSNVVTNTDGTKSVVIDLTGTQTEYTLGSVSKGINIILTTDITVNKLTSNKTDNVVMYYSNNYIEEETKTVSAGINIVAPVGVVTVTTISGYEDGKPDETVISQEPSAVRVKTNAPERLATLKMNVINNYNNTIENVTILGRTMFAGNKEIINGVDLTSNMDVPMSSGIAVSGVDTSKVKIYYSENGEATKDVSLASNGWTLTPADLSKVKSYLIVVENTQLATGQAIDFNYNITIPANLTYNKIAMQEYVVFFNNNGISDNKASSLFGLMTGSGAVLEATLTSSAPEERELPQGDVILQTLQIRNTGTEIARNVKATVVIPDGLEIIEPKEDDDSYGYSIVATGGEYDIDIGNMEAGSTIERQIYMGVTNISEDTYRAETRINITADNIDGIATSTAITNTVIKSYFSVSTFLYDGVDVVQEGTEFKQAISVISQDGLSGIDNTIIELIIPEEIEFLSSKVTYQTGYEEEVRIQHESNFDKESRKLTLNIGTVNPSYAKVVCLNLKAGKLPDGVYDKEVVIDATIRGDNVRGQRIDMAKVGISHPALKIEQTATITENTDISAGDKFSYIYTIENLSNIEIENINITDILPKELNYSYSEITYLESGVKDTKSSKDDNGNPSFIIKLFEKQKIKVQTYVSAKAVDQDTQITNKIKASCSSFGDIYSNSVSHYLTKYVKPSRGDEDEPGGGGGSSSSGNKRISGVVWIDENKDGIKDTNEEKVKNVDVWLFNNNTGSLAVNSAGEEIKTTTNDKGTYTFSNIAQGNYTVIFLYDTANYSATTYKKDGIAPELNCDAIDTKITIGDEPRMAGITENIILTENTYNIDLGLVENAKFDLSINKLVSKITVQDNEKTETTDYNGIKLAKKDLVGRKINDSTIVVEYKIIVKNEGAISGYVKKIADYVPQEMKFSTELNPDWYVSKDREVLNSSLANTLINPGEEKEVTLILTKKMTNESLGVINNTAEIYESYNDLGLEDYDSNVANKATDEDDISGADILITVKTGEYVMFIGLSLGIIAVIGISAIIIKKKVLK